LTATHLMLHSSRASFSSFTVMSPSRSWSSSAAQHSAAQQDKHSVSIRRRAHMRQPPKQCGRGAASAARRGRVCGSGACRYRACHSVLTASPPSSWRQRSLHLTKNGLDVLGIQDLALVQGRRNELLHMHLHSVIGNRVRRLFPGVDGLPQ